MIEPRQLPWMWVIYDHPTDYPDHFVARAQRIASDGSTEYGQGFASPDIEDLHAYMVRQGLVKLARHPDDDPVILETWI